MMTNPLPTRRTFLLGLAGLPLALSRFSNARAALTSLEDHGGAPDDRDNAPAWNAALASGASGIEVGVGRYAFHTRPDAVAFDGLRLLGQSPWTSHLTRAYSTTGSLEPFIEIQHRGSSLEHLHIEALAGTQGGIGLYMPSSNTQGPGGKHLMSHVRLSGQIDDKGLHHGTFRQTLRLDGAERTIDPIGIRGVQLDAVEIFDAEQWLMVWWGTIACEWYGGSAVPGGGTAKGIAVGGRNCQNNVISANVDYASSSIAAGTIRGSSAPVTPAAAPPARRKRHHKKHKHHGKRHH
jgi:hypothetical protein